MVKIDDDISTGPISGGFQPPLVEEISELAIVKGVNLAQLMAKTYLIVEQKHDIKANLKVDELEKHQHKLKTVTEFLSELENQIASSAREVNMIDENKRVLVDQMRELLEHKLPLLENGYTWSKADAETIKIGLTRHSQIIMQQVSHAASDVNRAIENGTELLQIARKVLEMYQQFLSNVTRNQRAG